MKVLVCGGRDFAAFPGHDKTLPNYEYLLAKYNQDHKLLAKTLYQFCLDRGLFNTESGEKVIGKWPDENWMPEDITIITGAAKGADTDAIDWAVVNWVHFQEFPADWKTHGKKAGPIRNQQMLDEGKPDAVIAFPGGRGTADMVRRAKAAGLEVIEVS